MQLLNLHPCPNPNKPRQPPDLVVLDCDAARSPVGKPVDLKAAFSDAMNPYVSPKLRVLWRGLSVLVRHPNPLKRLPIDNAILKAPLSINHRRVV